MDAERFVARDTKSALEKVKAKLGAEALILSTERTDLGIVISAASGLAASADAAKAVKTSSIESVNDITLGYLDRELKALREVLYNALGERSWQEASGRVPVSSAIEQRLHTLGLSKLAIDEATTNIDFSIGLNDAWAAALANLTSAIDLASDAGTSLNETPKAVIGGSSGCRSLICQQLIEKSLQEQVKASGILVVSFTKDPSGALIDFCKRKGVKRTHLTSMPEVRRCLQRVGPRKKVIIETGDLTPSLGMKDPLLDLFIDRELAIEVILVAPATYQSEILRSLNSHIKDLPIIGAIVSRTSETLSLGAILDFLILSELPLIGVSRRAERVVKPITASGLVNLAKRLARERVEGHKLTSVLPNLPRTA